MYRFFPAQNAIRPRRHEKKRRSRAKRGKRSPLICAKSRKIYDSRLVPLMHSVGRLINDFHTEHALARVLICPPPPLPPPDVFAIALVVVAVILFFASSAAHRVSSVSPLGEAADTVLILMKHFSAEIKAAITARLRYSPPFRNNDFFSERRKRSLSAKFTQKGRHVHIYIYIPSYM